MWADRISVCRSTGYSAFELVYGRDAILPVDLLLESWAVVDWVNEVNDRKDLLLARMRQLDEKNLVVTRAARNLENSRRANKAWFDLDKRIRKVRFKVGDIVLLYNAQVTKTRTRDNKLRDKWRGPFRIRRVPEDSTHYYLAELDGTELKGTFAGNQLKRFYTRDEVDRILAEYERIREAGDRSGEEEGDVRDDAAE